ncbi:hypothetical protein D9M68_124220 [compost metagenome]
MRAGDNINVADVYSEIADEILHKPPKGDRSYTVREHRHHQLGRLCASPNAPPLKSA